MGRLTTVALVGAVVLLGIAATVDALRGDGGRAPVAAGATTTGADAGDLERALLAAGLSGTIVYSDADDCRLHAIALPSLRATGIDQELESWASCGFALDADGRPAPEGTVFPPDGGERQAAEVNGGVELIWPSRAFGVRFENARAPAFRADGTLTIVRDGRLIAYEPCRPGRPTRPSEWPGYCPHVVTTEDAITESFAPGRVLPRPKRVALVRVVWLRDDTLLAVAQIPGTDVLLHVQPTVGHPVVNTRFQAERIRDLVLSPSGRYVAVLSGTGRIAVLDPFGLLIASPGLRVRALSWSRDERWLAVLTGPGLAFVRAESPVTQIGPITLSARDLGWR
jgi:hypothetical protein